MSFAGFTQFQTFVVPKINDFKRYHKKNFD